MRKIRELGLFLIIIFLCLLCAATVIFDAVVICLGHPEQGLFILPFALAALIVVVAHMRRLFISRN
jgi:hypothetical protein